MQDIMKANFKTPFLLKSICLATFLWASLCPSLHQLYHLSFQNANSQCFHQDETKASPSINESPCFAEISTPLLECIPCLMATHIHTLWLIERQVSFIFITPIITLEPDDGEQKLNQACKIGYDARAGPRVS